MVMATRSSATTTLGSKKTTKVGFLLLDHFTMIALASSIEPLRMANQLSADTLYNWSLISEDGQPVTASDGLSLSPDLSIYDTADFDLIIVAGGVDITRAYTAKQASWLSKQARKGVTIGVTITVLR